MHGDAAARPHAELLSELFERSPFPTFLLDRDTGRVSRANRAFAELLGSDGADMAGITLEELLGEDLPVLYMTGYLDPGDEARVDEGVDPVIPKPFTRAELARRVREVLEEA